MVAETADKLVEEYAALAKELGAAKQECAEIRGRAQKLEERMIQELGDDYSHDTPKYAIKIRTKKRSFTVH